MNDSGWHPFEDDIRRCGYLHIAGVDEVGRGCLAGPVVAAAVIVSPGQKIDGVADSKQLSEFQRESLYPEILKSCIAVGVGKAEVHEVDALNILHATHLAMRRAIETLSPSPDYVLIDGNQKLPLRLPQRTIIKGDAICYSIAAASIVAKVTRDRWMDELDILYPDYGFAAHKGYGTARHLEALRRSGPTSLHRRTFRGVRELIGPSTNLQMTLDIFSAKN